MSEFESSESTDERESTTNEASEESSETEGKPAQKKIKRSPSLSSIDIAEAELKVGTKVHDIIWDEYEEYSKIYEIGDYEAPKQLLEAIFNFISASIRYPYPSEWVLEINKTFYLKMVIDQIVSSIKEKHKIERDEDLINLPELLITIDNIPGKIDYTVLEQKDKPDWLILMFEVKKEGTRYGLKQMMLYLTKAKELNPGLPVGTKGASKTKLKLI